MWQHCKLDYSPALTTYFLYWTLGYILTMLVCIFRVRPVIEMDGQYNHRWQHYNETKLMPSVLTQFRDLNAVAQWPARGGATGYLVRPSSTGRNANWIFKIGCTRGPYVSVRRYENGYFLPRVWSGVPLAGWRIWPTNMNLDVKWFKVLITSKYLKVCMKTRWYWRLRNIFIASQCLLLLNQILLFSSVTLTFIFIYYCQDDASRIGATSSP
jgi:hypothetical protein